MVDLSLQLIVPFLEPASVSELSANLSSIVAQLNQAMQSLEQFQRDAITITNDIATVDFGGKTITNVKPSRLPSDVVTRKEITDLGLPIGSPRSPWKPVGLIDARTRGIRSRLGIDPNDVAIISQLTGIINTAIIDGDFAVPSIKDGAIVDLQDRDGKVGSTPGTLLYATATEGETRARLVRATEHGIVVDSSDTEELLVHILEVLERIDAKLGD